MTAGLCRELLRVAAGELAAPRALAWQPARLTARGLFRWAGSWMVRKGSRLVERPLARAARLAQAGELAALQQAQRKPWTAARKQLKHFEPRRRREDSDSLRCWRWSSDGAVRAATHSARCRETAGAANAAQRGGLPVALPAVLASAPRSAIHRATRRRWRG